MDHGSFRTSVVLLGAGRGAVTLMRASLIAEHYGRTHYGAIGGALALFVSGAAALAPVGAGVAYQLAGGYPLVFAGLAGISGLAALAMVGMWIWGVGGGVRRDEVSARP